MFMLFAGDTYHPAGGWEDFVGAFDTHAAAMEAAANVNCDWWHIATFDDGIVSSGRRN